MTTHFSLHDRASGLLLHPTSLPGGHGCGDLGPAAFEFVDFLAAAGQRWWQMLPVNPPGPGNSPYSALSAFAGNPLLISLELLAEEGLLDRRECAAPRGLPADRVSFGPVTRFKLARLRRAFDGFLHGGGDKTRALARFCQENVGWLDDYALFMALRQAHRGRSWLTWEAEVRARRKPALLVALTTLRREVDFERFVQYQFERQWSILRRYAQQHGVGLIGDIPIFVAHESSDVWTHPELFDLRPDGRPRTVSGVPPDLFSRSGQLWNHPQYRWSRHEQTGFAWWLARFARTKAQFDAVRIDHFLGFHRVWAVPGGARHAVRGKWVRTPGAALFAAVRRKLGRVEIIAEDLGLAVPEAIALRERLGFPGMRLLQCAFGNDAGDRYNQPHTYPANCVVYPGTHDNETLAGWLMRIEAESRKRSARGLTPYARLLRYLGRDRGALHWEVIRLALASPANTAIIPAQDLLGLDNRARMNTPATTRGNWAWRLRPRQLTARLAARLRDMAEAYGRCQVSQ